MEPLEERTMRKVTWRIVPFIVLLFVVAYLDRVNIGIASLQMNQQLGFSSTVYAIGAGIFFIGYFVFEIPSNLILHKVGARKWIARIMLTWGLVSAATAFIWDEKSFIAIRLLLGVFEAGFFPGIILYITYWFPPERRAKIFGLFMMAGPVCNVIGTPLSSMLLGIDWLNLHGWQWMFLIEGLPACLLAGVVLVYMTDRPSEAKWLEPEERAWLTTKMAEIPVQADKRDASSFGAAVKDGRIYAFGLAYVGIIVGVYGIILWLPQIVKSFGYGNTAVGFIAAIPFLGAVFAQILWTRHSDRTGERLWHVVGACVVASLGLGASAWLGNPTLALLAMVVAAMGVFSAQATFWTLPTSFLVGSGAAGGIAMINSIGNLGGFLGPYAVGYIKDATGTFQYGMLFLAIACFMAGIIIFLVSKQSVQYSVARASR